MNCPVCGKLIKDEAIFCAHCGSKIPRCPTCGKVFDKPVRFCGNDGTPLPEEMFAVLIQKQDRNSSTEGQPHIRPAAQPRLADNAVRQSQATKQKMETTVETVPVYTSGKKQAKKEKARKPVTLILFIILFLLVVGISMVIGVRFSEKLRDVLPENLVEVLLSEEKETAGEEGRESEKTQQESEDGTISESVNTESEEMMEGDSMSAADVQEQMSDSEETADTDNATTETVAEETGGAIAEESDVAEDTSVENDIAEVEEEEPDKVLIFILNSDSYYFTEEDIADFDADMCRLARNGIYAKMGRKFNDESLTEYFSQYDWYEPTIEADDFSDSLLNDYQIANRDLIVEFETAQGYR